MNKVFSTDDLPDCRLRIQQVFSPGSYPNGAALAMTQDGMRQQLAAKMMEKDDLFRVRFDDEFMFVTADVVVMSSEQLAGLMRSQYLAGKQEGMYMRTPMADLK